MKKVIWSRQSLLLYMLEILLCTFPLQTVTNHKENSIGPLMVQSATEAFASSLDVVCSQASVFKAEVYLCPVHIWAYCVHFEKNGL